MVSSQKLKKKGGSLKNVILLEIDLTKHVFQLHGDNEYGEKVLGKKEIELRYLIFQQICHLVTLRWKRVEVQIIVRVNVCPTDKRYTY